MYASLMVLKLGLMRRALIFPVVESGCPFDPLPGMNIAGSCSTLSTRWVAFDPT